MKLLMKPRIILLAPKCIHPFILYHPHPNIQFTKLGLSMIKNFITHMASIYNYSFGDIIDVHYHNQRAANKHTSDID